MIIDVVFLIVIVIAIFKGFTKGLIVAIFSLLAFIIGLAAALKLSVVVAHYLESSNGSAAKWIPVLSFAIVFFTVAFLISLAARVIKRAIGFTLLGWVDRLGGILFYLIIYTIIFSVFLFFAEKTGLIKPSTIKDSRLYEYIFPWGPQVIDHLGKIIPFFKDLFDQLQNFFEKMSHRFDT